jgi:hypothetical protein
LVKYALSPSETKPPETCCLPNEMRPCTSNSGTSLAAPRWNAPDRSKRSDCEREPRLSLAAKRALSSWLRLSADLSVSAGAVCAGVCAGAGAGLDCTAAGAAAPSEVVRAFCTARAVAPSRRAPRTARRNGREIAIDTGIGSLAGWV